MVQHLTVFDMVAVLGLCALVCLGFVLLHRAVFNRGAAGSPSSNTLFDFVSTIGG